MMATAPHPAPDRWAAWDHFVESTPATGFMQSSWWAELRAGAGFENVATIVRNGGDIVGGAVVQRFCHAPDACFYYAPEGPVLPAEPRAARAVFAAILHDVEARRREDPLIVSHLRIEPRWTELPDFVIGFQPPRRPDRFVEP